MSIHEVLIPAQDGFDLSGTAYISDNNSNNKTIVINSGTAVPKIFYNAFALFLADLGYTVITYDYRGIGGSKPESLRGFHARIRDWTLKDMAGVIYWTAKTYQPEKLFVIGHSLGGQTMGMVPCSGLIDAMVTLSSQSGYWLLQGGFQKASVAFHMHFTFPLLSHLFGYMPFSWFGSSEDIPKGAALEWAKWCRQPGYLLDDQSLPLERYEGFQAPVLAYSFDDDNWGTKRSVDAMMKAYPNLTRRHVTPDNEGLKTIGHFGFFRPKSKVLWNEMVKWLETTTQPTDKQ